MKKKDEIELAKELELMLSRIRDENTALFRLIDALKEQNKKIIDKILNKSNQ